MDKKNLFSIPKWLEPKIREGKYSLKLLMKNKLSLIGAIVIISFVFMAVFAPFIAPYPEDSGAVNKIQNQLEPPSTEHPMGTDNMGRDIFSRIIYGTRISLYIGILAIGLALMIGVPLGALAGTIGGIVDEAIMRVVDMFLSFPPLLLALAISAALGPSLTNMMIAIAIAWWPWYTRLIRSEALSVKEKPFVDAAKAMGKNKVKIAFQHILPNSITSVIVQSSMDFGSIIITAASLSFLGLGAQPPTPEWGRMIASHRNFFLTQWWTVVFPGLIILIFVLSFNLLGDGLRDILDPRTRRE
ncbi:MAG: nickel transporter permease [Candidatus Natronoplasma sp.]